MSENKTLLTKSIIAIVTEKTDAVMNGGVPIFICNSSEERERLSILLTRITGAMAHDLMNGVTIMVRH